MGNEEEKGNGKSLYLRVISTVTATLLIIIIVGGFNLFGRVSAIEIAGSDSSKINTKRIEEMERKTDTQLAVFQSELKYVNEKLCEIKKICERLEAKQDKK